MTTCCVKWCLSFLHTDTHRHIRAERHIDSQTCRQTDRHTDTHRQRHTYSITYKDIVHVHESLQLHPACCWFQPPPSPVVVILTACDLMYTGVHCRRMCVCSDWKPPLEQSAAQRHVSSKADCFSKLISFLNHFLRNCFLIASSVHRV